MRWYVLLYVRYIFYCAAPLPCSACICRYCCTTNVREKRINTTTRIPYHTIPTWTRYSKPHQLLVPFQFHTLAGGYWLALSYLRFRAGCDSARPRPWCGSWSRVSSPYELACFTATRFLAPALILARPQSDMNPRAGPPNSRVASVPRVVCRRRSCANTPTMCLILAGRSRMNTC